LPTNGFSQSSAVGDGCGRLAVYGRKPIPEGDIKREIDRQAGRGAQITRI